MKSVYSAVRTGALNKAVFASSLKGYYLSTSINNLFPSASLCLHRPQFTISFDIITVFNNIYQCTNSKLLDFWVKTEFNSGRWPTWRTISSIICSFQPSTCFEHLCFHPQDDNCINTTSDIITVCKCQSGLQVNMELSLTCINIFFFLWCCDPTRVMASSFLRFPRSSQTTTLYSR